MSTESGVLNWVERVNAWLDYKFNWVALFVVLSIFFIDTALYLAEGIRFWRNGHQIIGTLLLIGFAVCLYAATRMRVRTLEGANIVKAAIFLQAFISVCLAFHLIHLFPSGWVNRIILFLGPILYAIFAADLEDFGPVRTYFNLPEPSNDVPSGTP